MSSAIQCPPGLTEFTPTEVLSTAQDDLEWEPTKSVKLYTNAFVLSSDRKKILLGLKKRGFGVNKWNGFGGKVEAGETPLQAAKRELKEESGVDSNLQQAGVLFFQLHNYEFAHKVYIFRAEEYTGEITESEEMRPQWFSTEDKEGAGGVPYDQMWEDDRYWLALLIKDQAFVGRCDFGVSPSGDKNGGDSPMTRVWFASVDHF
ncbi:hypothetical protein DL93DRAFT_2073599 [Clavulina sp. PMI_390]|nr:hypothetical protein DL93DRAFT_2073599 [Clavulina sp. PMI_390]